MGRAIASSCAYGTTDRSRLRWRLIGLVAANLALWGVIIMGARSCL